MAAKTTGPAGLDNSPRNQIGYIDMYRPERHKLSICRIVLDKAYEDLKQAGRSTDEIEMPDSEREQLTESLIDVEYLLEIVVRELRELDTAYEWPT